MQRLKKWGVLILTELVVLAAVVLPRQISALRDRGMLAAFHVEPLGFADEIFGEEAASAPAAQAW